MLLFWLVIIKHEIIIIPNLNLCVVIWVKISNKGLDIFDPKTTQLLNRGASFRWSFGPHSAWSFGRHSSKESTTILTTHPSLDYFRWPYLTFFDPGCHRMFLMRAYWRASIPFQVHLCSRTIQLEHLVSPNLLYCHNGFYKSKRRLDLGILHLRYELGDHLPLLKTQF